MINTIYDIKSLRSIESYWNTLSESINFSLIDFDWFYSCAVALSDYRNLCILYHTNNLSITGIAPLAKFGTGIDEHYEILGTRHLGEPTSLLANTSNDLSRIINSISLLNRPTYLSRLYEHEAFKKIDASIMNYKGIAVKRSGSHSAYIPITTSWDNYRREMPSKKRYDLKRGYNRAKKIGRLIFRMTCPNPVNFTDIAAIAFYIESSGWKSRNKSSLRTNLLLKSFFSKYLYKCSKNRTLRIAFLYLDEAPIAALVGVESNNSFWILKVGYDERWKPLSPGIQVINETLKYCFDNQLFRMEFLGSEEAWINKWHNVNYHEYLSLNLFPANAYGFYAYGRYLLNSIKSRLTSSTN